MRIFTDPSVCDNTSDWFHCWESNVGEGTCTGEPNSTWIRNTQVCNGLADCPNGEDESILECKHEPKLSNNSYFYCATGVAIEMKQKCDGEVDCSDGSDEMQTKCQPGKQINRRGNCKGHWSFEYRPGECVREIGLCDGKYDCSNGFDESLEVCYQQWHNETHTRLQISSWHQWHKIIFAFRSAEGAVHTHEKIYCQELRVEYLRCEW
ncbi:very low-density lipoprotein receptor-like [Drosophila madeirensis]|uniref:Very low-density lipoprotein receptor-like n=1 Tax=Drosophila madeirensis TaxID=30013 RepID=A0AAU9F0Y9_DROMD